MFSFVNQIRDVGCQKVKTLDENGDLNAKKFLMVGILLFMTAKESCDAFRVEISRRNRLVQNAKKIPASLWERPSTKQQTQEQKRKTPDDVGQRTKGRRISSMGA